jgi:hypothetical protein
MGERNWRSVATFCIVRASCSFGVPTFPSRFMQPGVAASADCRVFRAIGSYERLVRIRVADSTAEYYRNPSHQAREHLTTHATPPAPRTVFQDPRDPASSSYRYLHAVPGVPQAGGGSRRDVVDRPPQMPPSTGLARCSSEAQVARPRRSVANKYQPAFRSGIRRTTGGMSRESPAPCQAAMPERERRGPRRATATPPARFRSRVRHLASSRPPALNSPLAQLRHDRHELPESQRREKCQHREYPRDSISASTRVIDRRLRQHERGHMM